MSQKIAAITKLIEEYGPLSPTEIRQLSGYTRGQVNYILYHKNVFVRISDYDSAWNLPEDESR